MFRAPIVNPLKPYASINQPLSTDVLLAIVGLEI